MTHVPTLDEVMTKSPHTIGEDIKLSEAIHRMREYHIHHLPVLNAGVLVGILSDRDVKLALSVHPEATDLKVADVMTEVAYAVPPETPLDEATAQMAKHKYGCTVVQNSSGKTIGIFTANDAVRVLTNVMRGIRRKEQIPLKNSLRAINPSMNWRATG